MPSWYIAGNERFRGPVFGGAAGSSYTGPGDVITTADAWWGLRAYSSAQATGSQPCIDIVKTSDGSAPMTINILATGKLDTATIAGLGYAVSVSKIYDQIGSLHAVQATLANMPDLVLNSFGALPGLRFDDDVAVKYLATSGTLTRAQAFNISAVSETTGEFTFNGCMLSSTDFVIKLNGSAAVDTNAFGAGTDVTFTATNNILHAINCTYNSSSSASNVDGTEVTGVDISTGGFSAVTIQIGRNGTDTSRSLKGFINEVGVWPTAWNATQRNQMRANQQTYWGTP